MIIERQKPNQFRRYAVAICAALLLTGVYDAFSQSTGGGAGGGGTPGGSTTQIQYNNGGAFGGISTLTNVGGAITNSKAGAASTPAETFSGAPFTGGTATTTFPLFYLNQGSTAVTTFSTNGTEIGVNAPSGFTGLLMDMYVNGGSSLFNVNASGNGGVAGSWFVGTSANVQSNITFAGATGAASIFNGLTGNAICQSQAPAFSGTGLGTSPTVNWTNGSCGGWDVSVGTGPTATTWTITFAVAAAHGYNCDGTDITTNSTTNFITKQVGGTTTTAVMEAFTDAAVAGTYTAADHIRGKCGSG